MFGKATVRDFEVATRSRAIVPMAGAVLCAMQVLFCFSSDSPAAIVGTGDLSPTDPATWTYNSSGIVGQSFAGAVTVNGGSVLLCYVGYLGLNTDSTGTVTVSGAGSRWNSNRFLFVGNSGNGVLNIEAGAQGYAADSSYLGYEPGSTGTATITGADSTWTTRNSLHVGVLGSGTLTVSNGGAVTAGSLYASLSDLFGDGTISAKGAIIDADLVFDSTHGMQKTFAFGNGGTLNLSVDGTADLGAGKKSAGTLRIADGIAVASYNGCLGYNCGSSGTATVTGIGSKWTNSGELCVGSYGNGALNIHAGGEVSNLDGFLGRYSGSTGTATVAGIGSKWTNNGTLYVGNYGSGTLTVSEGGLVTAVTLFASLSDLSGNGTITTKGAVLDANILFDSICGTRPAISFGNGGLLNLNLDGSGVALGAGYKSAGTLTIADGVAASSSFGTLGYSSGSTGTATITGVGSKWTMSGDLYVGRIGSGTLTIEAGGAVSNYDGRLGYDSGAVGMVTVTGTGSTWTNHMLVVGNSGNGSINVVAGAQLSSLSAFVGYQSGATGTATVSGVGSAWTNTSFVYVGDSGCGTLKVEAGGQLNCSSAYLGYDSGATGTATIGGTGSAWVNSSIFFVGYAGTGRIDIEAGAQVSGIAAYLGNNSGATGTATICGVGSKWTNSYDFFVGLAGNGTLNLGSDDASGGLLTAKALTLAYYLSATGTCSLNHGGTLQMGSIRQGYGIADFHWNDGTIRNYDANTGLTISSNLVLKLASLGTHSFDIDPNRTGTIDAVLADATSGGSLKKTGAGTLTLTAVNTYSGGTIVEDGRFKVTGSILNTNSISVGQAGVLELAKAAGSATAVNLPIDNAGTVLISVGTQTVGTITGTGTTQITGIARLTASSITQNTLMIGGSAADMSTVPEPSALVLLGLGGIGLFACVWRRWRGNCRWPVSRRHFRLASRRP